MTYKYKVFTEVGVNGYTLHAKMGENDTLLGVINGWHYVHSDAPQEQDVRIEFQEVVLSADEKEQLKLQRPNKPFEGRKRDGRYGRKTGDHAKTICGLGK